MAEIPPLLQKRLDRLPKGLRDHVHRTRQLAGEMAKAHGLDVERTDLASAAHDIARATKAEILLQEARRFGMPVHPVEEGLLVLLHGPVAAQWLEHEIGIHDPEILEAVRFHSTATTRLGPIAKVVFLADKVEPEKIRRRPQLERIRDLTWESLDKALVEFINLELSSFIERGGLIHPAMIEARNELLVAGQALRFDSHG